jgi:hypothetical protein
MMGSDVRSGGGDGVLKGTVDGDVEGDDWPVDGVVTDNEKWEAISVSVVDIDAARNWGMSWW